MGGTFTWSPEVEMTKEELRAFLTRKLVARVATIRKDGTIHITPLWYLWENGTFVLVLGKKRQHVTNLRRNPNLSAVIDVDVRPEAGTLQPGAQSVLLRGKAELFDDHATQIEYTRKLLVQYLGPKGGEYVEAALQDGEPGHNRVIVKTKPAKVLSWDFAKMTFES